MLLSLVPSCALVRRELVGTLRKRRSFLFLAIVILIVTACLLSIWPSDLAVILGQTGSFSGEVLVILFAALLSASALFIPGLAGSAIAAERDGDTLEQLQLTLLSPTMIILSKLVAMLAFYTLLVISVLPFLAATLFLLGVSVYQIVAGVLALYLTTLCCASAGLLCSAYFRRSVAAIVMSYVAMPIAFGVHVPLFFMGMYVVRPTSAGFWLGHGFELMAKVLMALSPFFKRFHDNPVDFSMTTVTPLWVGLVGTASAPPMWFPIGYHLCFVFVCVFLAQYVLSRPARVKRIDRRRLIDDPVLLEVRRKRFPYYLIDPLKRRESIEDGLNPMFVREFRWGILSRLTFLVRGFYVSFVVAMLFAITYLMTLIMDSPYGPTVAQTLTMMALACFLGTGLMSNAMTKERELGNLDMLRMTLLRPREIAMGKLGAGLLTIGPFLPAMFLTVMLVSIGCAVFSRKWGVCFVGLQGTIMFLVCTLLCLTTTLWASIRTRKTIASLLLSFGINLLTIIGLYYIAAGLWALIGKSLFRDGGILWTAWRSFAGAPLSRTGGTPWVDTDGHVMRVLGVLSPITSFLGPFLRYKSSWPTHVTAWCVNMCGLLVLCYVFFRMSVRRLARYGMRDDATRRSRPIE